MTPGLRPQAPGPRLIGVASCLGIITWSLLLRCFARREWPVGLQTSSNAGERKPLSFAITELFRGPNLAPGCSVIAGEKRLQVRQNFLLRTPLFSYACIAASSAHRLMVYAASGSSTASALQRPFKPGIFPAFAVTSL